MNNILPRWYYMTNELGSLKNSDNDINIIEHAMFMVEIDDLVK